jgi:protein-disulfide isomerase
MKLFCAFAAAAALLSAQTAEPGITRQQGDAILQELKQIRQLLEKQGARQAAPPTPEQPTTAKITDLTGVNMLGRKEAPITIVEYTDYQCPFCQRFHVSAYPEIKKNYIDTGKVRFFSKDLPLDFHPNAMRAAMSARCAGEQGKFWEMRVTLMRNANLLTTEYITKTAADLKLDAKPFASCTASAKYDADIQSEIQEGTKLGVGGTPTFVMGKTTPNVVEGPVLMGALPYAQFDAKLKELLR